MGQLNHGQLMTQFPGRVATQGGSYWQIQFHATDSLKALAARGYPPSQLQVTTVSGKQHCLLDGIPLEVFRVLQMDNSLQS